MALNYSHRPISPGHMTEDNLISPMRVVNGCLVEGVSERNGDGFARPRHEGFARPRHGCCDIDGCWDDYGRDRVDNCCSPDLGSKDIVDLLPSDPFGMDISTTFTAAITGLFEDFEADYGGRVKMGGSDDYALFAGFNLIWNNAMRFQSFPGNIHAAGRKPTMVGPVNLYHEERNSGSGLAHYGFPATPNEGDMRKDSEFSEQIVDKFGASECISDRDDGADAPHEALIFALGYLGLKDLLSVGMVCKSLQYTVQSDPLLWKAIHIEKPLNKRISDDILLHLCSRAHGNVQCLSLPECARITDDGLRRVLDSNPRLNKLCVPACTRISIDGIISNLRTSNNKGSQCIKCIRIGGLCRVTHEHFEELKLLLGAEEQSKKTAHKPHFYTRDNIYLPCDDERFIDVEICPRCRGLGLVYDCPVEGCQPKDHNSNSSCRACILCIPRCSRCGRCVNDTIFEEVFDLDFVCSYC